MTSSAHANTVAGTKPVYTNSQSLASYEAGFSKTGLLELSCGVG